LLSSTASMKKLYFLFSLIIAFSIHAPAQRIDTPQLCCRISDSKPKGAVHTILTIEQNGEEVLHTWVEVFDKSGQLVEQIVSGAGIDIHSGRISSGGHKSFFNYDTTGRLISEKHFWLEGNFAGHKIYSYDEKNRLIKVIEYDSKGEISYSRSYKYFPEKREILEMLITNYKGRSRPYKTLLSYNENGLLTKRYNEA
jgi:hypothetical protein